MRTLEIAIPDKLLAERVAGLDYIAPADEGEAIGIASGYYLATGKRANVYMSADGFCNALNPLTSHVIPENIEMNIIISVGRQEYQHKVMSDILEPLIKLLPYDPKRISFEFVRKQ